MLSIFEKSNQDQVKKTSLILRALNHDLRIKILNVIAKNNEQQKPPLTVTEIYIKLKLEQSVASQHLAILRTAGLVKTKREGKYIYYSLNEQKISNIIEKCGELNEL